LDLFLFTTDVQYAREALRAGIDGLVVDWEHVGKEERQSSADTEINHDTPDDLRRLRRAVDAPILVRINAACDETAAEVEEAIAGGATEILLPMVRRVHEVEELLRIVDGRCGAGILIETADAVRLTAALSALPLTRVYAGLNDLAIDRGLPNIFTSLADGTVESVRDACARPFGFGGLTHPDRGTPIPSRLLVSEMVRMECAFSFLRRSFRRDAERFGVAAVAGALREEIARARQRPRKELLADRDALASLVRAEVAV